MNTDLLGVMIKMGGVVSLVRTNSSEQEIKNSISEALALINFKPNDQVKSVAIKPNLCYYWGAATGYTTDPRVVAGIIDYVREIYGMDIDIKVVEADATAMRTKHAFLMLGYEKLAEKKNVELFNLSNDSLDEKKVQVNGREIAFKVPQSLLKADLFINVPKLKIMRETQVTCAFKNIFGCIASPRKVVYHPFLDEAIVGINKILHPNLTIVDGLIALGRFPVKLGLIMASTDPFSIDWIASQIMRYNPSRIGFLRVAMKEKLGYPNGIMTRGESINTFKDIFPKKNFVFSGWWLNIQLGLLRLYTWIVKDVAPPMLEEMKVK